MAETNGNGRRLDDRIKVVVLGLLGAIGMATIPFVIWIWGQLGSIRDDFSNYKLYCAERYVTQRTYSADIREIKELLKEVRDELRNHERDSRDVR